MNSNTLLVKIEHFIKKFYQNQLIRGAILSISLLLIAFFTLSIIEYFGRFSSQIRTVLIYLYGVASISILVWYIIRPILGLVNINRKFGIKEASIHIGNHFPEIKDKLLNTLQLQEYSSKKTSTLLLASINQRTIELSPIPFTSAIPLKNNFRYVKYALLPALVLLFVLFVSPGFKASSTRIVNFDKYFEELAPFRFETSINNLKAVQNQNVEIPLCLKGDAIPQEAYILIGNQRYKMKDKDKGHFSFIYTNIQKPEAIVFEAGGFKSREYKINVSFKPSLVGYKANIKYPKYLGLTNETLRNIGELNVPEGTVIDWTLSTKNVEAIRINPSQNILQPENDRVSFSKQFLQSTSIAINTENNEVENGDSIFYLINVIRDEYPQIIFKRVDDSLSNKVFYFLGDIKDDYGFSQLKFHYRFTNTTNPADQSKSGSMTVKIDPTVTSQNFYHYWTLESLTVKPEDEIEYYFEVWDNDGVNGAKSTKTNTQTYKAPSTEQIKKQTEQANKEIKNSLESAQSDAAELEDEIESIEKMLTEKKNLDWNDKKKIQDLLEKQKDLEKKIRNSIERNLEKNRKENEFTPQEQSLLDKQKKLEELMEEVLDDETRELMEKIEQLLQENKKDQLQKALDEFKFSEKEISKEMDRMLELFKELELEKKLNETINKLNKLAKEQKELAEETKKEKGKNEDLHKKQKDLKSKFEIVKKNLQDIQKKNTELESPKKLSNQKDKQNAVDQKMNDASQKQQKGKNQDAGESMDDAAKNLQEIADQMQQEMEDAQKEQQTEDYNNLRQILENLVQLSFDQENLINGFKTNKKYSPRYVELRQRQRKIQDETKIVEDSLLALSKRNIEIQSFVNDEIAKVNDHLDKSLEYLNGRYTNNAIVHQQYTMTSYNNLALMLANTLKQMQDQMKSQKQGKGSCDNPGGNGQGKPKNGKPNPGAIKKMQQELAEQMKKLQEGQQKGQGNGTSKDFAEMAAKQAAIRKKMQELDNQLNKEGKRGSLGNLKKTQDMMDDLEEDLYNKRLNSETFKKLNQIEIQLSEHEKAAKKQGQDDKRISNEGVEVERPIPPSIQEYLNKKKRETEHLRNVSPELQPYYQKKVKEYFGK